MHSDRVRRKNNSTYIKDEGDYFLKKIFEKYGRGEKQMGLADFELLLGRIGFEPERVDGAEVEGHDEPHRDPSASTEQEVHDDDDHKDSENSHSKHDMNNRHREHGKNDHHREHGMNNHHREHDMNNSHHERANTDHKSKTSSGCDHKENHGQGVKDNSDHDGHGDKGRVQTESDRGQTGHRANGGPRVRRGVNPRTRHGIQHDSHTVVIHTHDLHTDCLSVQELMKIFHVDERGKVGKKDLLFMSPAILYQLDNPHCRRRHDGPHHHHVEAKSTDSAAVWVWGYSVAAVVVISLVGLLGVAVIPIMQKFFYNQLLQFLVAVAVGALTGDAMLHLLPHAIAGGETAARADEDHDHGHLDSVWKGLCGLLGIYFFFIVQQLMTILTGTRNKRRAKRRAKRKAKYAFKDESEQSAVAVKLSSYTESDWEQSDGMAANGSSEETQREQRVPLKQETSLKERSGSVTGHTGHTAHGHSHHDGPLPGSVSAVAWMVILGDGVHNFSDGLAIGAAFANSITGGISTSIAVFCHELPHEIGDFAVLLKAGMSVKQAVVYNCLSSVLCFIGMLIGVVLGNIEEASLWIFASVGGMFIYISLVTMVPELTSTDTQNPLRDLFLQCVGVCVGSGIMLIIAIYEEDLLNALG
ncbi:zinc transporter ZIP10-like [Haliotis rubra]|uniref:zinc transporter ZIP10-like n=1 Tax=Haliotis rubra TaxID=36100 RepID=UPI001EE50A61|nr:zinc transporter ZIP10-like [Haliotis rubra]